MIFSTPLSLYFYVNYAIMNLKCAGVFPVLTFRYGIQ